MSRPDAKPDSKPPAVTGNFTRNDAGAIRPARPADTSALLDIARDTGVFKPAEIQALDEVLRDYHDRASVDGHRAAVLQRDSDIAGFVYFAPAEMTDRTWCLWWIAVRNDLQTSGLGTKLLQYAEEQAKAGDGRVMFIETSSLPHYEPTRRFYLKHGYEQDALLRDYYSEGDHMIVLRKLL